MQFNINHISNSQTIKTIDAHTEGEPLRLIIAGYPDIPGNSILQKRAYLTKHLDHYRKLLMLEPRGHADMYGALLTEACSPESAFGLIFMHNEGYSSMCGHGVIAAVTIAIETKALALPERGEKIAIDVPAGIINAYAHYDQENKLNVSFDNVPCFVEALEQSVLVPNFGVVNYDLAFGGAYYAFVNADQLGLACTPENQQQLIVAGQSIKKAIQAHYQIIHPLEQDLSVLYGTIFYSNKTDSAHSHSRHVCIFADGEVDRSPTGTGVSARIALLAVKEKITERQDIVIESIVGGNMRVNIQSRCDYFGKPALIPQVSGRAFITGHHTFILSDDDIFPQGFLLR